MGRVRFARMFRLMGNRVSPGGERARLTVLMYHRVLASPDPILGDVVDAATFDTHMSVVSSAFNALPLGEACERLARGALPERAICVTFDDGYADNESLALPILMRHGIPATFFVASGYLEGGIMFNDAVIEAVRRTRHPARDLGALELGTHDLQDTASRRRAVDVLIGLLKYRPIAERNALAARVAEALDVNLPRHLMMTRAQVKRLHEAGMEIGAHTVNHPILASLTDEDAWREIAVSKAALEEITAARVTLFAYPNGKPGRDYNARDVRLVRDAGFGAAVSTTPAIASRTSDLFQLPRLGPWDKEPARLAVRLLMNCARAGA